MDFLQSFFEGRTMSFEQLRKAIELYNELPENRMRQIKVMNISNGTYVSRAKFDAKLAELQNLRAELRKRQQTKAYGNSSADGRSDVSGRKAKRNKPGIANDRKPAPKKQSEIEVLPIQGTGGSPCMITVTVKHFQE